MCTLAAALRRLSVRGRYAELDIWPNRRAVARPMGEDFGDDPDFYFAVHRRVADLGRCWRAVNCSQRRIGCCGDRPKVRG